MYVPPFSCPAKSYTQALQELTSALRFGIVPMLESVSDMLCMLGNPDHAYKSIQIAGTNGKTSTARYTASILKAHGLCTGLYTSPGLTSYTDRIEIDGVPISECDFACSLSYAFEAAQRVNAQRKACGLERYSITEFDLLTVAACFAYARAGVDVVVFECGMGGRWDATSAVSSIQTVGITGIGLDHMKILGDTLEKIAAEKAAIIKPSRSCVLGVGTAAPSTVQDVFLKQCSSAGVDPILLEANHKQDATGEINSGDIRHRDGYTYAHFSVDKHLGDLHDVMELSVTSTRQTYTHLRASKPVYQAANIACATLLAESFLNRPLDLKLLQQAVYTCPTPGRFQIVRDKPLALIDACHNPQSVDTFLANMEQVLPDRATRPVLLCAILADKDVTGIVERLASAFPCVICTQTNSPRALEAKKLAEIFAKKLQYMPQWYSCVNDAMNALLDRDFIACGSITLAGEVAAYMQRKTCV